MNMMLPKAESVNILAANDSPPLMFKGAEGTRKIGWNKVLIKNYKMANTL